MKIFIIKSRVFVFIRNLQIDFRDVQEKKSIDSLVNYNKDESPKSANSYWKSACEKIKKIVKEDYETYDQQVDQNLYQKSLNWPKSNATGQSNRSSDSLIRNHEMLMNKRKLIRSEARNQGRNHSNDRFNIFDHTDELLVNKFRALPPSAYASISLDRRQRTNYTPEEATLKFNDLKITFMKEKCYSKLSQHNENAQKLGQTMAIAENDGIEKEELYKLNILNGVPVRFLIKLVTN